MSDLRASIEQLFDQNNQLSDSVQTGRRSFHFISHEMILYKLIQLLDSNMEKDKKIAILRDVIFAHIVGINRYNI